MKRLVINETVQKYEKDILKIIDICKKAGYEIDYNTAYCALDKYSDDMCASWMVLNYSEDKLLKIILERTLVIEYTDEYSTIDECSTKGGPIGCMFSRAIEEEIEE